MSFDYWRRRRRARAVLGGCLGGAFLLVSLAACGGGGGASTLQPAVHLTGVAATGAPLAGGTVSLVDSEGTAASGAVSATGSYDLLVTGMTPPLLVEVVGTAGGQPAILHASATAADVAQGTPVNVTPLTELITAYALEGSPADVFRDPERDLRALSDGALQASSAIVQAQFAPVLEAYGVSGDPRTLGFAADGTGMDGALDALKIVPVQGASGTPQYELRLTTARPDATPVVLAVDQPGDAPVVAFTAQDRDDTEAAVGLLPAIDARLQALAGLFATGLPSAVAVGPYFADDFHQNGLDLGAWLQAVLLTDAYVGFTVSQASIESVAASDQVWVSFRLAIPDQVPWQEQVLMKKVDGQWMISGNHAIASVTVGYLARFAGTTEAPDTLLLQYVLFAIPIVQVDPRVDHVIVTGAGLPAAGLTMARSLDGLERDIFILKNDTWHWNGFNTDRCQNFAAPPDCRLDWSAVISGAKYSFQFFDAQGNALAEEPLVRRLMGTPHDDAYWLARRSQMPLFTATGRNQLTYANMVDTSAGAAFAVGGTVTLPWTAPTDPAMVMSDYWIARQYREGDGSIDEEHCLKWLYGQGHGTATCTWAVDQPISWIYADLYARDLYGNQLSQELSPDNPY